MEYNEGDIAEDGAGNFLVYKYGKWHPSNESGQPLGPIDASAQWGAGARELPNGTIERVGPRGGVSVVASAPQGESGVGKLTEAQGKAILYGGMMRGGETDYQRARREGYDPGSFRNQAAMVAGAIPFDGDFFGRLIRDDVSDRGRQAELRWAEGNLRQLTGAAATNPEIARVAAINFDRGNDELADQRYQTRADTYRGTRFAAGPGAAALGEYPEWAPEPALPPQRDTFLSGALPVGTNTEAAGGRSPEELRAAGYQRGEDGVWRKDYTADELEGMGYTYDPQGQQWVPPGGAAGSPPPPAGPQGGQPPEGPQGDGRAASAAARSAQGEGIVRKIDAFAGGALDTVTFGMGDEIAAGINTVLPMERGAESIWTTNAGDAYRANLDLIRGRNDADAKDVPVSRGAGQVAGAFVPGAGVARAAVGGTRLARAGRAALGGAAYGGAYGFGAGEGNALERAPSAATGAGIGALAGPVAPVAANVLGRVAAPIVGGAQALNRTIARPFVNALGDAAPAPLREAVAVNPLRSGMDRFADRSRQAPETMNTNALAFRSQEIEPTFADVVNDGGRGTLRALATRQTPARQAAREFADGRAAGLQDRISTQARRTISDDPRAPAEIRSEVSARRTAEADQAFGGVRGEVIAPERGVIEALRAPALKPAIEEAATAALNLGDSETANMLRQLTDGALDNPNGVQITVGMADRLARSLNGRAEAFQRSGNNDAASSYFALAERLRGSARRQVPGYDSALNAYAADSRLLSASELGEQFMSMEADQFAAAIAKLAPEERQIARAAARRAVERQAGTQGQAPGVAQRLSNGREQSARTQALTGDAAPVQEAMAAELRALRNAQGISPAQGSPTSMNAQDAMGAAGAARDMATGNVVGLASRAMNAIRSRGFSDAEAEAVVQAAIDPAQTSQLIEMLAQRMSRREARSLARAIRYQLTIAPQSGQQN